jgi:hypothetical protein
MSNLHFLGQYLDQNNMTTFLLVITNNKAYLAHVGHAWSKTSLDPPII